MPEKLSEKTVERLPIPARGNRITYFAGATIQGAKAPRGFGVRVTAGGARAFVLNYRLRGEEHRNTIGAWPDWSVLRAVREARIQRQRVDRGENPMDDKTPVPATKTVSSVLDDFVTRYLRNKDRPLRSADEYERAFERLVKPRIGRLGISELRRSHVAEMLDGIEDANGPVMADRTRSYLRKALGWYAERDDQFNLTAAIVRVEPRANSKDRARTRVLSDEEFREVWSALDTMRGPACYPAVVRVLLLTATRRSEAAKMRWDEIDEKVWTIPAARYKTRIDQVIPLAGMALPIIGKRPKDASGPFVFSTTHGEKPFGGYAKAKAALDKEIAGRRAKAKRDPMLPWTHHDLRRTARSLMSRAGIPSDHAERVLGHAIAGVRGVYDRHQYEAEKRDALEKLAAMIERILNPPPSNVATIAEHRAPA
jgi:integrase